MHNNSIRNTITQYTLPLHTQEVTYLSEATIKNIQRTVIVTGFHILHIILHLQLDTVAFIILTTLELLIAIFFSQPLWMKGMFVVSIKLYCRTLKSDSYSIAQVIILQSPINFCNSKLLRHLDSYFTQTCGNN